MWWIYARRSNMISVFTYRTKRMTLTENESNSPENVYTEPCNAGAGTVSPYSQTSANNSAGVYWEIQVSTSLSHDTGPTLPDDVEYMEIEDLQLSDPQTSGKAPVTDDQKHHWTGQILPRECRPRICTQLWTRERTKTRAESAMLERTIQLWRTSTLWPSQRMRFMSSEWVIAPHIVLSETYAYSSRKNVQSKLQRSRHWTRSLQVKLNLYIFHA